MNLTDTSKSLLRIATAIFLTVAAFWNCPRHAQEQPTGSESTTKADTVFIRDTFLIRQPAPSAKRITDTLLLTITQTDTLTIHDTLYLSLPREQRIYSDDNYTAWVSGFRPCLDSLKIYPQHQVITNTVTYPKPRPKRWGIGLQVGYGAAVNGNQIVTSPYICVGVHITSSHFNGTAAGIYDLRRLRTTASSKERLAAVSAGRSILFLDYFRIRVTPTNSRSSSRIRASTLSQCSGEIYFITSCITGLSG